MLPFLKLAAGFSALSVAAAGSNVTEYDTLPVVDLGYQIQQATEFNFTGQYYNFSNIRYAEPPVGKLRFNAPVAAAVDRSHVFTGSQKRICPQTNPSWVLVAGQWIAPWLTTGRNNFTEGEFNESSIVIPENPASTEDCLFLDVHVPKAIFDKKGQGKGAAVLVWIHGGGFVAGSKSDSGNPASLIARSQNNDNEGVVFVAFNYRLGAFGWLSGPTLQQDGVANAALYDQRMALEWIQKNIHRFGGDPGRVTVLGESAGGAAIVHQITAYDGSPPPFRQAVIQSAGSKPLYGPIAQEGLFNTYLKYLNVSTIAEARDLPYAALQAANVEQVRNSVQGQFTWGPVVDGIFTTSLPTQAISRGKFDKTLKIMTGFNTNEGILFAQPYISTEAEFKTLIQSLLPGAAYYPYYIDYVMQNMYPPDFSGAQGYVDQIGRTAKITGEWFFKCFTHNLANAFSNRTYSYNFNVGPAIHGDDIAYTFFNGETGPGADVLVPEIAIALQAYITHFAQFGAPTESGLGSFEMYGSDEMNLVLGNTNITVEKDPNANERCEYLKKGLQF